MNADWTTNFKNKKMTLTCLDVMVVCDFNDDTLRIFHKEKEMIKRNMLNIDIYDFEAIMHEAYNEWICPDFNVSITKEKLAQSLSGRTYPDVITGDEKVAASESGLIVIFGYSDDTICFRGLIGDDVYVGDDTDFVIVAPGTELPCIDPEEVYRKCSDFEAIIIEEDSPITENRVKALFSQDELDCIWLIKTEMEHATFDVMEDGELYCRGIIIDAKSL